MTINKFQAYPEKNRQNIFGETIKLPIDNTLGVYARQSTKNQVVKAVQSREIQTEDLMQMGKSLGWHEDKLVLFAENIDKKGRIRNASGKLRIDQREGLRTLIEYIERGIIKAVLVYMEDRLFRDETMIQVNTFIDICKRNDTLVITPHKIYDFHNRFDVRQFRWRCEEAADYLKDHTGRLNDALRRVSEKGWYDGRHIIPGFIVDRREVIIIDGQSVPNPNYRKFMEYEPHAQVIRRIQDLSIQIGCTKIRALFKALMKEPVLFPDFPSDISVKAIGNRKSLKKVPGGYHIGSENGLRELLINVALVGHWRYRGKISENNHPAITDPEKFWYIFNQLSPYLSSGDANNERPARVRFYAKHNPCALLKDRIETNHTNRKVYVSNKFGTSTNPHWYYSIEFNRTDEEYGRVVNMKIEQLDEMFTQKLMEKLKVSDCCDHYSDWLKKLQNGVMSEHASIENQIKTIIEECKGIQKSLRNSKLHEKVRKALEEDFATLLLQQDELEERKGELEKQISEQMPLAELKILVEKLSNHWDQLAFTKKKRLVEALVNRVVLDSLTPHFLKVTIEWDNPMWGIDEGIIWRTQGTAPKWTPEEMNILQEHYSTGKHLDLLKMLPTRSWTSIQIMAKQDLQLSRTVKMARTEMIPHVLSLQDYEVFQVYKEVLTEGEITLEAIEKRKLSNAVLVAWGGASNNQQLACLSSSSIVQLSLSFDRL